MAVAVAAPAPRSTSAADGAASCGGGVERSVNDTPFFLPSTGGASFASTGGGADGRTVVAGTAAAAGGMSSS